MRKTLLLLVLACASANAQTPQQAPPVPETGKISGVVTNANTGRPVEGVTIRAVRWEGGLGQPAPVVVTQADGRFAIERLRAGEYGLFFSAVHFVSLQLGQRDPDDVARRIGLKDAQHFDTADMALPPTSAIEGRLLDEFGDPAPGILVQAARVQFLAGKRRLMPAGGAMAPKPTDDLGRFRVPDLPPGVYYLMALAGPFAGAADPSGFAVTYFPGTIVPMEAQAVRVEIGKDTTGLAFSMTPAPMSHVSGVLVDATDKPIVRGTVMLIQTSGGDVRSIIMGRVASGRDGSFAFRNIAPGSYVIQAFGIGTGNLGSAPFVAHPLTLSETTEITDLRVKVPPGPKARGRIVFDGDGPLPAPSRVVVSASAVNFASAPVGGGPPNRIMREDWTFEISNMSGIRTISAFAPRWTLKKVTWNGRDITDDTVDFSNGDVDGLEITFTSRPAILEGTVTDPGKPSVECTVILFAQDPSRWTFPSRYFQQVRPDPKGWFGMAPPPGDYLALALPNVRGTDWQDPEFLKEHVGLATRVTVTEGSTANVTLKVIR